jgi:hypothetical protein
MEDRISRLKRERNALLKEWIGATGNDKSRILTRIMEIDEQIENNKIFSQKRQRAV